MDKKPTEHRDNPTREQFSRIYLMNGRHCLFVFLGLTIGGAIIGPFVRQCITTNTNVAEALSIWNGFIGIALGLVATTLSIVSLVLNFKTYDDALNVQDKAAQTLSKIDAMKEDVRDLRNNRVGLNQNTSNHSSFGYKWKQENILDKRDNSYVDGRAPKL